MSLATVQSRAQAGVSSPEVLVEVFLARGLPSFSIVGMAETAVKESRDRVRAAIINSGFEFPQKRITVNLAPADLPKEGGRFDLPIAVGLLAATGQVPMDSLEKRVFIGELTLSGLLRYTSGSLVTSLSLQQSDNSLVMPACCCDQAALVEGVSVAGVHSLTHLAAFLHGQQDVEPCRPAELNELPGYPDMNQVEGQEFARFCLEVSASGGHNILLLGPPGSGKTMMASRLPGLLPELSNEEALEVAAIESLCDSNWNPSRWKERPFRAPHHSASGAAIIGGGSNPRPGEISRAHHGILFLDELTEFNARSLDMLREPMESGSINISRATLQVTFPSSFMLVGAANPCRCGYLGDQQRACQCTPTQISRYQAKLSGPLLDRIDIQINVPRNNIYRIQSKGGSGTSSREIRIRVTRCRNSQLERQGKLNSRLMPEELTQFCALSAGDEAWLSNIAQSRNYSTRSFHKVLKLARTLADLRKTEHIHRQDLAAAINMRCLDKRVAL